MNPIRWLQLVVLLILVGGGVYGVWSYRHMAQREATADARIEAAEKSAAAANALAEKLAGRLGTLSDETIRRDEFDAHLREERGRVSRNLDTASREDPTAADFLRQPIPQRVRDAYSEAGAEPAR